jgi:mercuric ion transport protein
MDLPRRSDMSDLPANAATDRPLRGAGATLLTLGGLGAAFGAASCCALPFLLAGAGLGTAWLGGVAELATPYRVPLLAISAASLLGGGLALWRQRARAYCAPGAICARPAVRRTTALGLLLGAVLLYLGYAYV